MLLTPAPAFHIPQPRIARYNPGYITITHSNEYSKFVSNRFLVKNFLKRFVSVISNSATIFFDHVHLGLQCDKYFTQTPLPGTWLYWPSVLSAPAVSSYNTCVGIPNQAIMQITFSGNLLYSPKLSTQQNAIPFFPALSVWLLCVSYWCQNLRLQLDWQIGTLPAVDGSTFFISHM